MNLESLIGLCRVVFEVLGKGHSEAVYHRALEVELRNGGIAYESEVVLPIRYKNHVVGSFRIDLVIEGHYVVELKAVPGSIRDDDKNQLAKYLGHANFCKGAVVNFNQKSQEIDYESMGE